MAGLLFCPFCKESFDTGERCPEHDVPLVSFDELERTRARHAPPDEEAVSPYDLAFGRGFLALGACFWIVGFFLPFVRTSSATATGLELASTLSLNLWMVPILAFSVFSVLLRRRTPVEMRGARLATLVLIVGTAVSTAFTLRRIFRGAGWLRDEAFQDVGVEVLAGPYVVALGVLIALVGVARFGKAMARAPSYRV